MYAEGDYSASVASSAGVGPRELYGEAVFSLEEVVKSVVFQVKNCPFLIN